jgi:TonB family protein
MKTLALLFLLSTFAVAQEQPTPPSAGASAASAPAPAVDPALAADIHRLLDNAGMMQLLRQQFDQMMQPTLALMKQNSSLAPEFADETMRRVKEKFLGPEVEQMTVDAYAKYFTRSDIQQMIAYQESPVGRKARQQMPQLLADLMGTMREYGERVGRDAALEVIQEHPEYLKKSPPQSGDAGVLGGVLGSTTNVAPGNKTPFNGPHIDQQKAEARLIKKVEPVYPPLAKAARVQGAVHFAVVLGTDGKVETLNLISGHPLLVNAAKEAVQQWEYQPFLVDGKPVRVITEVEVNFHLDAP